MILDYKLINQKYAGMGGSSKNSLDPFIFSPDDIKALEFKNQEYGSNTYVKTTYSINGETKDFILNVDQDNFYLHHLYVAQRTLNGQQIDITLFPNIISKIILKDGRVIELVIVTEEGLDKYINYLFAYWQCNGKKLFVTYNVESLNMINCFNIIDSNSITYKFDTKLTDAESHCWNESLRFVKISKDGEELESKELGLTITACDML